MNHIKVEVTPNYIEEQSEASNNRFVFSYQVCMTNLGTSRVQLMSRHWGITDGDNKTQEVHGEGVLGHQPHIAAGEHFNYTSGAIVETSVASMHGSYQMLNEHGEIFEALIPSFTLAAPLALH